MSENRRLPPAPLTCAPMHRALAALLLLAALLTLPAAALAQSAGDEQYVDPFQGDQEQPAQQPQEAPAEPTEAAPAEPAPAAPATPSTEGEVTAAPAQTEAPTLPRTGLPVLLILSAGYALMLAGVALRRTL
jgi:hypothetical protein